MQTTPSPETLYRLAAQAGSSGVVIVDKSGHIVFANQALAEMFGYPEGELVGQPIEVLVPEQTAAAHRRHRDGYAHDHRNRVMGVGEDFEGLHEDGRRFPVEIGLRSSETETGRLVVATVVDITQRKQIEDRLRRQEQGLEELVSERTAELRRAQKEKDRVMDQLIQAEKMAAVGTLASGIGHEINNPLYVILALAEAVADAADVTRSRKYGREILEHARHIAATVRNLSGYAQPGSRHDLEPIDLNESISAAVLLAKRSIGSDAVDIRLDTTPVPRILAKPDEMQQVLFNIIHNGIQASGASGVVRVESRGDEESVTVRIRDSGPGIPEEARGKIFDPFFTTKSPGEGQGLGLYVVQQIVAKYDGTIEVDCESGVGTAFNLRFPIALWCDMRRV